MSTLHTIEYDGSGNARAVKSAPAPQPKTGKYGVFDASTATPRVYSGAMTLVGVLFATLGNIKAELFSERARLSSIGRADVAVWFGPNHGWAWIENAPYPGVVPFIEWRDGCPRCGSLEHVRCNAKLGTFTPDPPSREIPQAQSGTLDAALGGSFIPAREYVSPEEQAEFDRISRDHPDLVVAARASTATLTQACRLALRNLKALEARNAGNR